MRSFKDFYMTLNEGGNVIVDGEQAQKIPMDRLDEPKFKKLKEELMRSFKGFNDAFNRKAKKPLWADFKKLVSSGMIFSGSTRLFFNKPLKSFSKVKKKVGDMDLQVPVSYMGDLRSVLEGLKGKKVGNFKWRGFTSAGLQFNGILETTPEWHDIIKYIQVDFEGTEFSNNEPTEFATFGHSSSWTDIQKGIKGLFIKYLVRAITSSIQRGEVAIVGKKGKRLQRPDTVSFFGFSVDRGFRKKLEPVLDDKGKIIQTDGLPTYREIPSKGAKFVTDIPKIFEFMFGRLPKGAERRDLKSFAKTLKIMKKEFKVQKVEQIFWLFIRLLWSKGSQGIERNNPAEDKNIKMAAYKEFLKVFPFLKKHEPEIKKMIEEYYSKYRMT